MDPEARPSIAQLLQAFAAVATGRPLPNYEIPDEAIERRKEREITAKKREEKNKNNLKKTPSKLQAPKPSGPLDSNSVAARRLAMKKGGGGGGGGSGGGTTAATQNDLFETDFSSNNASSDTSMTYDTPAVSAIASSSAFGFDDAWGSDVGSFTKTARESDYSVPVFDAFNDNFNSDPPPPYAQSPSPSRSSNVHVHVPKVAAADSLFDWSEPDIQSHSSANSALHVDVDDDVFGMQSSLSKSEIGFSSFGSSPRATSNQTQSNAIFDFDYTSPSPSSVLVPSHLNATFPVFESPSRRQEKVVDFLSSSSNSNDTIQGLMLASVPMSTPTFNQPSMVPATRSVTAPMSRPVSNPQSASRMPTVLSKAASSPAMRLSYELDLFDTTPGPPEIDFLSLENPVTIVQSTPSVLIARQQASDVLAMFDKGSGKRDPISPSSPGLIYPAVVTGKKINQRQQLPQQQQQQQQQQTYQWGSGMNDAQGRGVGLSSSGSANGGFNGLGLQSFGVISSHGISAPSLPDPSLKGNIYSNYQQRQPNNSRAAPVGSDKGQIPLGI